MAIYNRPEWMTRTQYRILEGLDDCEIFAVQSPSLIAYNLDISQTWASQQLSALVEKGYVDRVEKGKYRITERGRAQIDV